MFDSVSERRWCSPITFKLFERICNTDDTPLRFIETIYNTNDIPLRFIETIYNTDDIPLWLENLSQQKYEDSNPLLKLKTTSKRCY